LEKISLQITILRIICPFRTIGVRIMDGSVWVQAQKQRNRNGRFAAGVSGNPAGKRKGTVNRMTRLKLALSVDESGAVTRAVIDRALAGDRVAQRLCFAAILPKAKARPVEIDLPECDTIAGVVAGFSATVAAMAAGEITPDEALKVTRVLERKGRALAARDARGAAEEAGAEEAEELVPAAAPSEGDLHPACKNRQSEAAAEVLDETPVAAPRLPLPTFGSACIRPVITGRGRRRAVPVEPGTAMADDLHSACNYRPYAVAMAANPPRSGPTVPGSSDAPG
jgi:hypothetical protein